ncbi:MAG TPA: ABC transporter ATP-binding protein [Phycisphaerae bacterium]|nr:ABC transporter ATP-binding protein [Phycisphaerae bacterium]
MEKSNKSMTVSVHTSSSQSEVASKGRIRFIVKVLPFAIRTAFKAGPFLLILLVLITILSGFVPATAVYVGKLVLDAIVTVVQSGPGSQAIGIVACVLGLQFAILVVGGILDAAGMYVNFLTGKRLSLRMNADIIKKVARLDYAYFDNPHFYDMMTRAQRESAGKPLILLLKATSVTRGIIMFLSMGGMVAAFSVPLFTAMLIICVPLLVVQVRYGEQRYSLDFERTEDMRLSAYASNLMMTRQYIPEILSFGLWEYLYTKWHDAAHRFLLQDMHLQRRQTLAETLVMVLTAASTVGATGYIIYVCVTQTLSLSVGDIIMYSGAFAGGLTGLKVTMDGISGIYENALFLHDLVEFNKLTPAIELRGTGRPVPSGIESIELQDVSFKYPGSSQYALRNVSVTFGRSESTLIAGSNGAGKTTLIRLLTRLYDPDEGRILLNGVDIREYEIQSLRAAIGIIFQEFIRYAFSAKENIACGSIGDAEDTERIVTAAKRARAHSLIENLPQAYDTILSMLFRHGQELSLGQWQRICLARLFMKDAPVMVLDEPTASLDIETEAHVLREVSEMKGDKICILVSHRMFRQDIADRIIVLSNGRIVEAGDYESLIAREGEFARLWKLYSNRTGVKPGRLSRLSRQTEGDHE